jgi:pyruvyltransferase
MRVFWCATCGGGHNFGDQLTPALLAAWGIPCEWSAPAQAEMVMVGSILSKVPDGWTGIVMGTGFIRSGMRKNLHHATVLAVRGPYTRDACHLPEGTPLGDCGLLVEDLIDERPPVEHAVGVLAHHVDHRLEAHWPKAHPIDVHLPPAQVVSEIAKCHKLVTSSLHGVIAADALGIPHRWEPHSAVIGGRFKFADYALSLDQQIEPETWRLTPRAKIGAAIARLRSQVEVLRGHC